ncbi:hypothetical protein L226DRAFT_141745 [Lentinus tigrinus ALCF2SS1-7]|uniref:uncharacterized protein n=1 Tax=Lentinus tigrinus ALCF2SS1-7 TaxID=1328758 RepID=UPI001165F755|nr:hypothetical protein L226DRAFT_141745 [Lentinus tigrinus ALCF2SS1-7]
MAVSTTWCTILGFSTTIIVVVLSYISFYPGRISTPLYVRGLSTDAGCISTNGSNHVQKEDPGSVPCALLVRFQLQPRRYKGELHELLPLQTRTGPQKMSSAAFVQGFLINNYCECAAATLLFFEYFVHLAQEIDLFWKERLTGASVLFLSNRYLSLLNQILLVFPSPTSEKLFILRFHLSDDWPAALLSMGSIFRLTRIGAVSAPWQMAHRDARPPIVFRAYRDQLRRLSLGELRCNTDNWMLR